MIIAINSNSMKVSLYDDLEQYIFFCERKVLSGRFKPSDFTEDSVHKVEGGHTCNEVNRVYLRDFHDALYKL